MRLLPTQPNYAISYDDIEFELECQFRGERPLDMRNDWIDTYISMNFDLSVTENPTKGKLHIEACDFEEYMGDPEDQLAYFKLRNLLVRYFNRFFAIAIEEEVDFEAIYSLYSILVLNPYDYMVKYIKGVYKNQVEPTLHKFDEEGKSVESANLVASMIRDLTNSDSDKTREAIGEITGEESTEDQSETIDAILRIISNEDLDLESYLEMIDLYEPGNTAIAALQDELHAAFTISVEDGDVFRNGILKPYLDDVNNVFGLMNRLK